MTSIRWFLIASVFGGVAFDVVHEGSEEYACKSEIARVQQEIALLRHHIDDYQVGIQQRLLARVPTTGIGFGDAIVRLDAPRQPTLWERSEAVESSGRRAFASETEEGRSLSLADWLQAR